MSVVEGPRGPLVFAFGKLSAPIASYPVRHRQGEQWTAHTVPIQAKTPIDFGGRRSLQFDPWGKFYWLVKRHCVQFGY